MASFVVNAYKVRLFLERSGNPVTTSRTRLIEIIGAPEYHGIVQRANLAFSTSFDNWSNTAAVGYYSTANPLQPVLTGWLPSSEYSYWYDVIRAEKPLNLFFNISPINGASYVNHISLGTSSEPIGEGPEDFTPWPV
jgi:hypothetical protein